MKKHQCSRCEKSFESYESLRRHVSRIHKIHSTDFFVEYNLNGIWPTCKCGCGGKLGWSNELKGFTSYVKGHHSRVHNNWGHNSKAIEKSAETRRKQFASGERTVWNKGLDSTDERVKNNVQHLIELSRSDEERSIRSVRMKEDRLDGTIPTLRGKDHSQWAGGVSSIKSIAHCSPKLYQEWRYPIFVRDGFKCTKCESIENLQVHHNDESMASIVRKFVPKDTPEDLPFEEKRKLADQIIAYHIDNKISGVTLCEKCHGKLHPSLNFSYI